MNSTIYSVPNDIKTYDCPACNKNVSCLRWKEGANRFKCENCWEKAPEYPTSFYDMLAEKIGLMLKR